MGPPCTARHQVKALQGDLACIDADCIHKYQKNMFEGVESMVGWGRVVGSRGVVKGGVGRGGVVKGGVERGG